MSDLLLYNARVYSCTPNNEDIAFNTVGIKDGKISLLDHITRQSSLDNLISSYNNSIDLENKWLTPGLIDCHTHLVFAGERSNEFSARINGESYEEITKNGGGINKTVTSTRKASFTELYQLAEERLKQMLEFGVTTVEIKSGYGLDLESESKILQVADKLSKEYPVTIQKTFLGAHVIPKEYKHSADEYIQYLANNVLPELKNNNLVDAVDCFCEKIAFTAKQLKPLFEKARKLNLPVKGHTEQLSKIGGAELICQYQGLSCDHLEFADASIVEQLASSNVTAVLLPGAYYYLNEQQKPPVDLLRENKVPIAIATDFNPGTSPILSLPTVMNMACVLYRLTPKEVWQAVTHNAAKALALDNTLGSIELNKQADLIVWDFNHPFDLCYYMGADFNKTIIKNGISQG